MASSNLLLLTSPFTLRNQIVTRSRVIHHILLSSRSQQYSSRCFVNLSATTMMNYSNFQPPGRRFRSQLAVRQTQMEEYNSYDFPSIELTQDVLTEKPKTEDGKKLTKERKQDPFAVDKEKIKERKDQHPALMAERHRKRDQKKLLFYLQTLVCINKLDIYEACRIIRSLKSQFGEKVSGPEVCALIIQGVCRYVQSSPLFSPETQDLEYKVMIPRRVKGNQVEFVIAKPPEHWSAKDRPKVRGPFASIYYFVQKASQGPITPNLAAAILQYSSILVEKLGVTNWSLDIKRLVDPVLDWLKNNQQQNQPDPLFHSIYRTREEQNQMMNLLARVDRDYDQIPLHPPAPIQPFYENNLLMTLNEKKSDYQLPSNQLLDKETLERNLDIQIENERKGYVEIELGGCLKNESIPEPLCDLWERQVKEGLEQIKQTHHAVPKGKYAELQSILYILDSNEIAKLLVEHLCRIIERHCFLREERAQESFHSLTLTVSRQIIGLCRTKMKDDKGYADLMKRVCKRYYNLFVDPETSRSVAGNYRLFWRNSGIAETGFDPDNFYNEFVKNVPPYIHVGTELVDILIQCATVQVYDQTGEKKVVPCLSKELVRARSSGGYTREQGELYMVRALGRLSKKFRRNFIRFDTSELPMIVPPVPWTSSGRGCFHLHESEFIRVIPKWGEWMEECEDNKNIDAVLDSLNQLSSTPWRVNNDVFDVAVAMFNDAAKKELSYHNWKTYFDNLALPRPASLIRPGKSPLSNVLSPKFSGDDFKDGKSMFQEKRECYIQYKKLVGDDVVKSDWIKYLGAHREQANNNSLWHVLLYKLAIAQHYRNKYIWFPHNMDFRGRVYPTSTNFHYMADDLTRSLFLFAKGKPLGKSGLDWLKIHCINLTGLKKRNSNSERLAYANEILKDILSSGRSSYPNIDSNDKPPNPETLPWWMRSEEPWQTLACCIELYKAYKSADPTKYISHLPIHQDGSCNGLQHYSALGRDLRGGTEVNLVPRDKPGDLYARIAENVEQMRQWDANKSDNEAMPYWTPQRPKSKNKTNVKTETDESKQNKDDFEVNLEKEALTDKAVAQLLVNKGQSWVQRKVVKQTVMTTVYGVTKYGAGAQIRRKLKDINKVLAKEEQRSAKELFAMAKYLADKVFEALQLEFPVTRKIQQWFVEGTHATTKYGQPAQWFTPLGIHVVQPYWKIRGPTARTEMQSELTLADNLEIKHMEEFEKDANITKEHKRYDWPLRRKQGLAFPPNYIHSLDSTHMMLTAMHLHQLGITFAAVHDCYWTHGADIDIMNNVLRQQFVTLHQLPLLEQLKNNMISAVPQIESDLRPIPERGRLNIEGVLESSYFFS